MYGRRRYRRGRRAYRRKARTSSVPWYAKKYSTQDIAMSAWKTAKYLKSVINVEKKVHQPSLSGSVTTTGTVQSLIDIGQGDTQNSRDGNSIKVVSLHLLGSVRWHGSGSGSLCRIILFKDNQQIADTDPAVSDVLESASPVAQLNVDNLGRFTILMDKLYVMSDSNQAGQSFGVKQFFKLNHHVRYNGGASTDKQKGGLYLLAVANEATNTPTAAINSQLRFVDN